jgi:hypothetical protein
MFRGLVLFVCGGDEWDSQKAKTKLYTSVRECERENEILIMCEG